MKLSVSGIDVRMLLSTLWIFVLLNVLFRDLHEYLRPGVIEEIMTGSFNGVQLTETVLLVGGIMLELQLLMIVLSRILPNSINRWANIMVAILSAVYLAIAECKDLDDLFFSIVEAIGLFAIIWLAWILPNSSKSHS